MFVNYIIIQGVFFLQNIPAMTDKTEDTKACTFFRKPRKGQRAVRKRKGSDDENDEDEEEELSAVVKVERKSQKNPLVQKSGNYSSNMHILFSFSQYSTFFTIIFVLKSTTMKLKKFPEFDHSETLGSSHECGLFRHLVNSLTLFL